MLYDAAGKILLQQSVNCTKNLLLSKSIDVSKLAAGLYQVSVLMPDNTILTGKFIRK